MNCFWNLTKIWKNNSIIFMVWWFWSKFGRVFLFWVFEWFWILEISNYTFIWTLGGIRVSSDTGWSSGLNCIDLDWRSNFNNCFYFVQYCIRQCFWVGSEPDLVLKHLWRWDCGMILITKWELIFFREII